MMLEILSYNFILDIEKGHKEGLVGGVNCMYLHWMFLHAWN